MHFWVSAARVSLPGIAPAQDFTSGFFWPRKMGTNWFMPALVNSRFGLSGINEDDGTMVCDFDLKKSRNDWRICDDVIMANQSVVGRVPPRPKCREVKKVGDAVERVPTKSGGELN